ncbi:cytochrome P450 [Artemisia annua]|uniref:Cytochrome P450 n=1 Tax=Artemisia annua TaxID=35608 RepID=A0A2U1LUZ6_ARTAN|nr:cytochrome P450 [Artemisia annua]
MGKLYATPVPTKLNNSKTQHNTRAAPTHRTSYVDVLSGKTPPPVKKIQLNQLPPVNTHSAFSIITELHSIAGATNTFNIIHDEGFSDFSIKYLGGLHVLVIFNDHNTAANALSNPTLKSHFKSLKPWNHDTHIVDRVTWITISGLPPHLWLKDVFSTVAETWGEVLIQEECSTRQFNRSFGKVCILTKQMDFIKELVHVPFGDDLIPIRVVETDGEIDSLFNGYTLTSSLYGESNGTSNFGGSDDESGEDSDDGGHGEEISVKNSSESAHMENVGENKEPVMGSDTCFDVGSTSDAEHAVNDKNYPQSPACLQDKVTDKESDTQVKSTFPTPIKILSRNDKHKENSPSLIKRCNLRILNNPNLSDNSQSDSLEVNNTITVGNELGFAMTGMENDVAHILGTESMSSVDNRFMLESMWGHFAFDSVVKQAEGKSGGIIAMWDTSKFSIHSSSTGDGFVAVIGNWIPLNTTCLFIVVYAPQDQRKKKQLWLDLKAVIDSANVLSLVMGDFNVVRSASERMGSNFCHRSASAFNEFISSSGLFDLPMGGMRFTRMNRFGSKLSKIDRILVSQHLLDKWPNSHILALTREFSDHSPLLLINQSNDFGPTPFKFYNSWLLHVDFHNIITNCWLSVDVGYATTEATRFKHKLKSLKESIKLWRVNVNTLDSAVTTDLRKKIHEIDLKAEQNPLLSTEIDFRIEMVKQLADLEHKKISDLHQKAKVRWAIEGDENSGYFHAIINNRRNRSRINGIAINGGTYSFDTRNMSLLSNNLRILENQMQYVNDNFVWKTTIRFDLLDEDKKQLHETCLDKIKVIVDSAAATIEHFVDTFGRIYEEEFGELHLQVWYDLSFISNQIKDIRDPYFITIEELEMHDIAATEYEEKLKCYKDSL